MRCLNCFTEYDESYGICPNCGIDHVEARESIDLRPGTILAGRYLVGRAVDAGGFGIIYKTWDEKLGTIVAIKEYYPSRLVTRATGQRELIVASKGRDEFEYRKRRFLAEARTMAKFGAHNNIPNVFEFFEENNTAYIVMEYLQGVSLNKYLKENGKIEDLDFAMYIINEVGSALTSLHNAGVIHRDVAPDNIFLCSDKAMRVKLLDLGAARLTEGDEDVVDIVLKPGYSPIEQYLDDDSGRKNLDERSDIYALGATLYMMLTGEKPEESTNRRIKDTMVSPRELDSRIPENLSNAIMKSMALDKHLRFKSVAEFLKAANGTKRVMSLKREKLIRKTKQIGSVVAALAVLAAVSVYFYRRYNRNRLNYELDSCTITIWYEAESSSDERNAMDVICRDFMDSYKKVKIDLVAYSPEEYEQALLQAARSDNLPNVFESTGVSDEVLAKCLLIENVLDSEQASDCSLLKRYYDSSYPEKKQIPIGMEIPMACVITRGPLSLDYPSDYYSSVRDLEVDAPIAFDRRSVNLLSLNYEMKDLVSDYGFFDAEQNWVNVLLTSSMYIEDTEKALAGKRQYKLVFPDAEKIDGLFNYEWSIGQGNRNQVAASERFISWLLGNPYQTDLMISYASMGQLPLCDETLGKLIETDLEYAPLLVIKNDVHLAKPDPSITSRQGEADDDKMLKMLYFLYETILGRDPESEEIETWKNLNYQDKAVLDEYVTNLFESTELTSRDLSAGKYVELLRRVFLHRDFSEKERESWLRKLASGEKRSDCVGALTKSDEWKKYCEDQGITFLEDEFAQEGDN